MGIAPEMVHGRDDGSVAEVEVVFVAPEDEPLPAFLGMLDNLVLVLGMPAPEEVLKVDGLGLLCLSRLLSRGPAFRRALFRFRQAFVVPRSLLPLSYTSRPAWLGERTPLFLDGGASASVSSAGRRVLVDTRSSR